MSELVGSERRGLTSDQLEAAPMSFSFKRPQRVFSGGPIVVNLRLPEGQQGFVLRGKEAQARGPASSGMKFGLSLATGSGSRRRAGGLGAGGGDVKKKADTRVFAASSRLAAFLQRGSALFGLSLCQQAPGKNEDCLQFVVRHLFVAEYGQCGTEGWFRLGGAAFVFIQVQGRERGFDVRAKTTGPDGLRDAQSFSLPLPCTGEVALGGKNSAKSTQGLSMAEGLALLP